MQQETLCFNELVRTYEQDVRRYSLFLCGNRDLAEDIAQETFLRAYRYIHLFRGDASFKTWLFKIAQHAAKDLQQKQSAQHSILTKAKLALNYYPSAEHTYFDSYLKDEICEIVLMLPHVFQQVIVLDVKYDRSIQEIAQQLQVSAGTVKSRLYRARIKISEHMMRRHG
ncbi:RNA polymerase sigma factor [Paenibacillus pinisoli]|uniref:RNA polymerase sigma factor n=1 Tax=Paenibacillus pinisoli TaxID=1276110 RepID=UPI0014029E01|nr:sigma-70 family RNA polymerase sigma factor [Paenibacillus pinisoli]